jgi:membrane associated rhomboid family serine protease
MGFPAARVTQGITWATIAAFLLLLLFGRQAQEAYAYMAGIVPARISGEMQVRDGFPLLLTPLTATLLHGNFLHLLFNMSMFYYLGRPVELVTGSPRFLVLYVAGAYAAAFAEYIATPDSAVPVIGASGAVSAILGAYAIYFGERSAQKGRFLSAEARTMLWMAAAWIGLQLLVGLVFNGPGGGIAIWAHIGGFIAGLALARPLVPNRPGAGPGHGGENAL